MRLTKKDGIALIELPQTQYGRLPVEAGVIGAEAQGEPGYDVFNEFNNFYRAIDGLAGIVKANGWNVRTFGRYGFRNGKIDRQKWQEITSYNLVGFSTISRIIPQTYECAGEYHKANPDGIVLMGGPHVTYEIEEALQNGADVVVKREGERKLLKILEILEGNDVRDYRNLLSDVPGIAFKRNGEIVENPDDKFLTEEELSSLPFPYHDKDSLKHVNVPTIRTTIGCPRDCYFCGVTSFNGGKYRGISIPHVIAELESVKDIGNSIFWIDDNLAALRGHLRELSDAIADRKLVRKGTAQVDVNAADEKVMEAMLKMGVRNLCIGFESNDDTALANLEKGFTAQQNTEAAKKFHDHGFWRHGMFLLDDPKNADALLEWAQESCDSAMFGAPGPIPGTRMTRDLKQQGRILTRGISDYSYGDGAHVLVRPLPESKFTAVLHQMKIWEMYEKFYSRKYVFGRLKKSPNKIRSLELLAYGPIAVARALKNPATQDWIKYLESID